MVQVDKVGVNNNERPLFDPVADCLSTTSAVANRSCCGISSLKMMSEDEADNKLNNQEALEVIHGDNKSSSTEGPDSPPHSPLGEVMIPAYPHHVTHDDEEEDGQSKPLLPLFSVKILDDVSKDGDVVRYKLRVKKLGTTDDDDILTVQREYDDFEFLHHVLVTHNQIVGLIVPPLPPRPAADPLSAESRSKKQFGSSARAMLGDDFKHDARNLERFLQQMLCHPVFGRDEHLTDFLWQKIPPIRAKIKKGFLAGVKETLDLRKTNAVKDSDDFFQKEKEWAIAYGSHLKEACDSFANVIHAQRRLGNQVRMIRCKIQTYHFRLLCR